MIVSLVDELTGFSVNWFTDNKNVALILNIGNKSHNYNTKYYKFSTFVTLDPLQLILNGFPGQKINSQMI